MPLWLRTLTVSSACAPGASESATGAPAASSPALRSVTITPSATAAGTPVTIGGGSSPRAGVCAGAGASSFASSGAAGRTAATCTVGSQQVYEPHFGQKSRFSGSSNPQLGQALI